MGDREIQPGVGKRLIGGASPAVLLLLALVMYGCGGGSGGSGGSPPPPPPPPDTDLRISGTVQKGLFQTLNVQALSVDKSTGSLGEPVAASISGQNYSIDVPHNQLTLLEATGTFTNDLTGEPVTLDKPLLLLVDPTTQDITGNINVATTLAAALALQDLPSTTLTSSQLIGQSNTFIAATLGMPSATDLSKLDYGAITATSDMTDPNMQLLILSTGLMELISGDQFFADGFGAFADSLLAATTLDASIGVMEQLNGLSASYLYGQVSLNSGYLLPTGNFSNDFSILSCVATNTCSWVDPGGPSISVAARRTFEAMGEGLVRIRLSDVAAEPVSVFIQVDSGTATAGEDFISVLGVIPVPAGDTYFDINVRTIIDALDEPTEFASITIESRTDPYVELTAAASLEIRDGAPTNFDDQDATGIVLESIRIAAVCNPRVNMSVDRDCAELTGQEASLGLVDGRPNIINGELDLAADCPSTSGCTQQATDWKVDLFLVATDNLGTAGEVPLGPYLYRQESVQLVSESANARAPFVRFTDAAVLALAQQAEANGWNLALEARIGTTAQVRGSGDVPSLTLVPGSVFVGDTELLINAVRSVSDGASAGCQAGQYAIDATYGQQSAAEGTPAIDDPLYLFGSLLPVASGVLCVDFDAAGTGAPAIMVAGQLDAYGGAAAPDASALFALPDGLYSNMDLAQTGAQGISALLLLPPILGRETTNDLHAEGWPFLFRIDRLSLTPGGIELGYSDMRYVMDVGYSSQDPRSAGIVQSNDIYYSGVSGQSGSLILGPGGVDGLVSVQGESGPFARTAYPSAGVKWQAFTQVIDQNRIQATALAIDEYRLGQRTSCSGPDCVQGRSDLFVASSASLLLDGDGYVLGAALNSGTHAEPRWGARGVGDYAWSRPDDLNGQQGMKLAIPGYVLPADAPAADYLLAHVNEPTTSPTVDKYPPGTAAFTDGNYHPPGLSIGPEIYRDPTTGGPLVGDGQNLAITGSRLRLDNGQDPAFDLQSSPAVKYVIRNAGITGVFNVESGTLGASAPQFYGYQIDLERFAVRTVDNVLDTYTWIDGRLALNGEAGGDAGLDIFFTNLEIDCSASLGNVDLLYEACDTLDNNQNGFTDENCKPVLASWKAETDIFAAGFRGDASSSACAVGPQRFALQHQMHFAALDKPVAFDTEWTPAGNLAAQSSGELDTYRFDRSAEGDGFPLKTGSGLQDGEVALGSALVDGENYGWLQLPKSQVGVPFWNSLETDTRVANTRRGADIVAEPTVVLPAGKLTAAAQRNKDILRNAIAAGENDNSWNIPAAYEWGGTGFGFRLPVYYQPWQLDTGRSDEDAQGRQSRFLGRERTKDLFVLDAKAGINFIEPDRTKLSFGASADFTRLEGITFQVDITDPESAAAVDKVLQDVGLTNGPLLEPALTDLLDTINIVNRFANRGMDELMQTGLEAAIEEIGKATAPLTPNGQDPFVTASEALTQIRSMPQQAVALISGELRAPLNNRLFLLETQLRSRLLAAETELTNLPRGAGDQAIDDAFAVVDELLLTLQQIRDEADSVDQRVESILTDTQALLTEAVEILFQLQQATYDVELAVSQAVSFADAACANGFAAAGEGNGYLNEVFVRFAALRRVLDIIQNTTRWLDAAETIAKNGDAKRTLGLAKERIQEATAELNGFVAAADDALGQLLCRPAEIDAVTAKVFDYTQKIRDHAGKFIIAVASNIQKVNELEGLRTTLSERVFTPIDALISGLETIRAEAGDYAGTDLVQLVDCILYNATKPPNASRCEDPAQVPPIVQADDMVNSLHADSNFERDVADLIFDTVRREANGIIDTAEEGLLAFSANLLPGAYMTPEQLRRFLVSQIMATQPVKDLRTEMDKHFGEIGYAINNIVLQVVDQVNLVVNEALAAVTGPINDALSDALAGVRGIPLQAAEMNGFATIAGNELERAHISAGWTMRGSDENDSTGFRAALDAESWSARHVADSEYQTPTACQVAPGGSLIDVKISAYGLPINVLAADITIDKLYLGFTLEGNEGQTPALIPVGIFGGINTIGEIGFTDAIVFDPAFAAGLGKQQTYIGASAGAVFSSLTADVAFLVGRVCPGNTALTDLDPDVVNFLPGLPASGFTGAYLRGGATIPIIPGGCALNVGVVADFGSWIFVGQPTTLGGLIGGGASGQVACIAALKGKATVGGSVNTDGDLKLRGEAWGVAGVGLDCDPGTWTSVPRSRDDSWCGTGDAQFDVTFDNGKWLFTPPKPSAIH